MNTDKEKVRVKFVKPSYPDGSTEILALFLGKHHQRIGATGKYMTCYAHYGQHSSADISFLRRKLATKEEYLPLLNELNSIGYAVTVANKDYYQ